MLPPSQFDPTSAALYALYGLFGLLTTIFSARAAKSGKEAAKSGKEAKEQSQNNGQQIEGVAQQFEKNSGSTIKDNLDTNTDLTREILVRLKSGDAKFTELNQKIDASNLQTRLEIARAIDHVARNDLQGSVLLTEAQKLIERHGRIPLDEPAPLDLAAEAFREKAKAEFLARQKKPAV